MQRHLTRAFQQTIPLHQKSLALARNSQNQWRSKSLNLKWYRIEGFLGAKRRILGGNNLSRLRSLCRLLGRHFSKTIIRTRWPQGVCMKSTSKGLMQTWWMRPPSRSNYQSSRKPSQSANFHIRSRNFKKITCCKLSLLQCARRKSTQN